MSFYDRMMKIDRRWLFLLVLLAVIIPLLKPMNMPIMITPPAQKIFDKIDAIPEGGNILIGMDFDPASKPELYPMTLALLRHCFYKKIKITLLTLWPSGVGLAEEATSSVAKEFGAVSGEDYVFLGYKAGFAFVILAMGESIKNAFPKDANDNPTGEMPIFENVDKLNDYDFMMDLAAGASVEVWIAYGKERYKFPMGAGCTAVSATQYYPYLNTGQLDGLLGGLKGAAEYEKMIKDAGYTKEPGAATMGMDAQSIVHLMTVIIVVITNILFFMQRRIKREEEV